MKHQQPIQYGKLITSIIICQLAGIIGSFFTITTNDSWYATLEKPFFQPPNWLFGPVWITLYTMIGISFYLIWKQGFSTRKEKQTAEIFIIQLILNALWTIIFFGMQSPMIAFIEILFLWASIIIMMYLFFQKDKRATYLLIPYVLWVTFAALLNGAIMMLN